MRWLRVMGLALVGLGLTTVGCGSDDSGGAEGGNNSSSNGAATCDGATTGGGTGATGGETTGGTTGGETTFDPAMCSEIVRPRANPVEYVGLTVSELATAEEVMAFLGAIYGDAARAGQAHQDTAIQEGLTLTVSEDPASAEQVILELNMEVARAGVETPRRNRQADREGGVSRPPASTVDRLLSDRRRTTTADQAVDQRNHEENDRGVDSGCTVSHWRLLGSTGLCRTGAGE